MRWVKQHKLWSAAIGMLAIGAVGDVTGKFDGWVLYELAGAMFLFWIVVKVLSRHKAPKTKQGV